MRALFGILTKLVKRENSNDEGVLTDAGAEILKYTDRNPPALLAPFTGGGIIPLEVHTHDLNTVAVTINKAMIETSPKFAGMKPVNSESRAKMNSSVAPKGTAGLVEDVRYYSEWMKREAFKRIGYLYPKAKLADGRETTVIAWIWARTVKCPNPACNCTIPLASSHVISKKKGKCAWVQPVCVEDHFEFKVHQGAALPNQRIPRKVGVRPLYALPAVR